MPDCTGPTGCNQLSNPGFEQVVGGLLPNGLGGFGLRRANGTPAAGPITIDPSVICGWQVGSSGIPSYFNRYESNTLNCLGCDYRITSANAVLKDLFDDAGKASGSGFFAFHNKLATPLAYKTFGQYRTIIITGLWEHA